MTARLIGAGLAMLVVTAADVAYGRLDGVGRYVDELSSIREFVEQMDQVDTSEVTPLSHPQDRVLRLREDVVTETDQREALQAGAPATENGLYLVPKVIE